MIQLGNKVKPRRACGDCTLCCTLMGVASLQKAAGEPCALCVVKNGPSHVYPDRVTPGCAIYRRRPQACMDFSCVWLDGGMPEELRPDKVGAVLHLEGTARRPELVVNVRSEDPDAWRRGALGAWLAEARKKIQLVSIVRSGLTGNPPRVTSHLFALDPYTPEAVR